MTILEFSKWLIDTHPDGAAFAAICIVGMFVAMCDAIAKRK